MGGARAIYTPQKDVVDPLGALTLLEDHRVPSADYVKCDSTLRLFSPSSRALLGCTPRDGAEWVWSPAGQEMLSATSAPAAASTPFPYLAEAQPAPLAVGSPTQTESISMSTEMHTDM